MIDHVKTPIRLRPCLVAFVALLAGCGSTSIRPGPPTVWPEVAAAHEAERCEDRAGAIRRLRAILVKDPGQREVRRELGLVLAKADDPAAVPVLAPLVAADPTDAVIVLALARMAVMRSDPAAASRHLALLATSPGDVGIENHHVAAFGEAVGVLATYAAREVVLDPHLIAFVARFAHRS